MVLVECPASSSTQTLQQRLVECSVPCPDSLIGELAYGGDSTAIALQEGRLTGSMGGSVWTGVGVAIGEAGSADWLELWALFSFTSRLWCRSRVRHCTRFRTGTCTCTVHGRGARMVSSWCSNTSRPAGNVCR